MNIASQELVEKLNLLIEGHPNPFRVAWVNDTSISISCRCLVTFLFGKNFEESVWCEVLLIKVIFYLEDLSVFREDFNMMGIKHLYMMGVRKFVFQ